MTEDLKGLDPFKPKNVEGSMAAGKIDPWSKAGLESQLQTPRMGGRGFASSTIAPYVPLGTPDLKRDRSLLPEKLKAHHSHFDREQKKKPPIKTVQVDSDPPLILPTKLRGCYWNGERWCCMPFLPRQASASNGSDTLRQEIAKSQKRLIACRMGKYFMKDIHIGEENAQPSPDKGRRKSVFRPLIPRLNLRVLPAFEYSDQLAKNASLVFAYHSEARRIASARLASRHWEKDTEFMIQTAPSKVDMTEATSPKMILTDRVYSTISPKAVEPESLTQLSNLLDKGTRFTAVQEKLNNNLKQIIRAIDSLRPFSYMRHFRSLQHLRPSQKSWDKHPTASPCKVETFRESLESHKWYKELIDMMFMNHRYPSKEEIIILAQIGHVLEEGQQFGQNEYIDLLKVLPRKGVNLNDHATSCMLTYIKKALKIPDEALLSGFLCSCTVIPAFLSHIDVPKNYNRLSRVSSHLKQIENV